MAEIDYTKRQEIFNKFGGKCAYCGVTLGEDFHIDHIHPRSRDGNRYDINNLNPACHSCNMAKSDHTIEEWKEWLYHQRDMLNKLGSYKTVKKFGLIEERQPNIKFYFERL